MSETATLEAEVDAVEPQGVDTAEVQPQTDFDKAISELNGLSGSGDSATQSNVASQTYSSGNASELIWDIPVEVHVVLGRTKLSVAKLMALEAGEIVDLNRKVGEPLDIVVNGKTIAKGEITMMENDESRFGVRLTELSSR